MPKGSRSYVPKAWNHLSIGPPYTLSGPRSVRSRTVWICPDELHATGRIARGIELDPRYVDLAIRRWQRQAWRSAVNVALQCTFDELGEARLGGSHG